MLLRMVRRPMLLRIVAMIIIRIITRITNNYTSVCEGGGAIRVR